MSRVSSRMSGRRMQVRRMPRLRRPHGYTLIEVVVAFAVLAFAMALLLGSLSNAVRQVRGAGDAGRAALHAQSILDQTGVGEALRPGSRNGQLENGRYRWELSVTPYVDRAAPADNAPGQVVGAPRLYKLHLKMRWGEGRKHERIDVRSLRLVTPTDLNAGGGAP